MTVSLGSDLSLPPGYWRGELGEWRSLPWPSDPVEKERLFANSLGPGVIEWAEGRTSEPGLINDEGESWRFTMGQAKFLILWYAFDERGRFIYRRGCKRGAKGVGKDPFGAAMCNIEFMGPSQLFFDRRSGRWRGKRHEMPLVQIASNSESQSKDMLRVANSQWSREATTFYGLDKGLTSTTVRDSAARMEVLTASERSSEGDPATFIAMNETHHMTKESGGHATAKVARRNVGKSKRSLQARMVDFTNAHVQGVDSIGERTYTAWQKQQSKQNAHLKKDILYDSIEADPRLDPYIKEERELAIRQAYSDAPWADFERLSDEILDPELTAADAIRFYLNGLAVAEDAFIEPSNFTALADPGKALKPGDRIALFLDCSKSEDATALMGCRIDDGFNQTLGVWSRPRGPRGEGFLVDKDNVDHRVREIFDTYKVVWFGVDPSPAKDDSTEASYWKPLIDQWHLDFRRKLRVWATPGAKGHSVMFDMRLSAPGGHERNRLFCTETEIVQELVDKQGLEGPFRHDGDPLLVEHTNNARCRFGKFGLQVGKVTRDSTQLVDSCVAMIGANVGRRLALNSGRVRSEVNRGGRRRTRGKVVMA